MSENSRRMEQALAGKQKGEYVAKMFGRIAQHYDLMNRFMSLGQDQSWRRRMTELASLPAKSRVLDLATGTGDVAFALLGRHPDAQVIGADFALPMMLAGQEKKSSTLPLYFVGADALALPFPENYFDAVFHAFLMRNIASIYQGFCEQWRILKPGGRVVCLEIVGPKSRWVQAGYRLFFETLTPRIGQLLTGDPDAYTYLPTSVLHFPPPSRLSAIMREAGFVHIAYERVMLGSIAIHVGEKPIKHHQK